MLRIRAAFAAACLLLPSAALADGHLEKLNSSQVAYRLQGIALIRNTQGKIVEASLADAPLGAGDQVHYLVVATNLASQPQVAGVALNIPEYTVWQPPKETEEGDIVEWTTDGKHWHSALPPKEIIPKVHTVRWVLADALAPKASVAFAFGLKLTGPYSDRTGDLNATKLPESPPVVALDNTAISSIQSDHPDQTKETGISDPLGLTALLSDAKKTVDYNGTKLAEVTRRNDVAYRASGTALVRLTNGVLSSVPLTSAKLNVGDKVRYAFMAQNMGDATRAAGAVFTLPEYARFDSAATRGDGIIEVTADFVHWFPPSKLASDKVRGVRWAYDSKLSSRQSAAFSVIVRVVSKPDLTNVDKSAQGALQALSASAIQSLKFTNDLSASAADVGKELSGGVESIGNSLNDAVAGAVTGGAGQAQGGADAHSDLGGVPLKQLAQAVMQPAEPGVVKSNAAPIVGATPVPTEVPAAKTPLSDPKNAVVLGVIGAGVVVVLGVFMVMGRKSDGGDDTRTGGSSGVFKTGREMRSRGDLRSEDISNAASSRQRRS